MFSRVKMPVTHLPVITTPTNKLWKGCVAAPSAWGKAVEKLSSSQTALKERTAAARTSAWAKAVEKVSSRQTALNERAAAAEAARTLAWGESGREAPQQADGPQGASSSSSKDR
jgi:hypothetical protein